MRFLSLVALAMGCLWPAGCDLNKSAADLNAGSASPPPPQLSEPKRAEVGVGSKGRSLEGESGPGSIIAAPAVALFRTKERVVFDIQIPHALQLFEAMEGRKPKTHEEFMTKIVQFNKIPLPELPEGQVYAYHPDTGDLWVEPVKKPGDAAAAPQGEATSPPPGSPVPGLPVPNLPR